MKKRDNLSKKARVSESPAHWATFKRTKARIQTDHTWCSAWIGHGPLLLIIFVNDLPNSVSQSTVDIYADDTTLSTSAVVSDLPVIQQRLQDCRLDI
ncbi:hypothetical protein P5673_015008 [Acropora cervicornis]|uniref:Reverse transcriptase domain-containing protein n=1 Tax=Acropora cervicornis TaxID=6130 RepID=A0AAD9QHX0_ACRCE|nr:hypothetical protein P5673_015008 [Acropora cervicornis]